MMTGRNFSSSGKESVKLYRCQQHCLSIKTDETRYWYCVKCRLLWRGANEGNRLQVQVNMECV